MRELEKVVNVARCSQLPAYTVLVTDATITARTAFSGAMSPTARLI